MQLIQYTTSGVGKLLTYLYTPYIFALVLVKIPMTQCVTIMGKTVAECHVPCTLMSSSVDFEKEYMRIVATTND